MIIFEFDSQIPIVIKLWSTKGRSKKSALETLIFVISFIGFPFIRGNLLHELLFH